MSYVKLSSSELMGVAQLMARELNQARSPVKVILPLDGLSSVDKKRSYFYDGEPDRILMNSKGNIIKDD